MPYFSTYEEEDRYRDGRRDAARGWVDRSVDCHFGDDADKAYCKGVNDELEERRREEDERRQQEEEEERRQYQQRMERDMARQEEEDAMTRYFYEQERDREITRQLLENEGDMIGSDEF